MALLHIYTTTFFIVKKQTPQLFSLCYFLQDDTDMSGVTYTGRVLFNLGCAVIQLYCRHVRDREVKPD